MVSKNQINPCDNSNPELRQKFDLDNKPKVCCRCVEWLPATDNNNSMGVCYKYIIRKSALGGCHDFNQIEEK